MEFLNCCSWKQRINDDPTKCLSKCFCLLTTVISLALLAVATVVFMNLKDTRYEIIYFVLLAGLLILIASCGAWIFFYLRDGRADSDANRPRESQRIISHQSSFINGPQNMATHSLPSDNSERILSNEPNLAPIPGSAHSVPIQLCTEAIQKPISRQSSTVFSLNKERSKMRSHSLTNKYEIRKDFYFDEDLKRWKCKDSQTSLDNPESIPSHKIFNSCKAGLTAKSCNKQTLSWSKTYEFTKDFYFDEDLQRWKCKDTSPSLDSGSYSPKTSSEDPATENKQHYSEMNTVNQSRSNLRYLSLPRQTCCHGEATQTSLGKRGSELVAFNPNPMHMYSHKRYHTLPSSSKNVKEEYILRPDERYPSPILFRRSSKDIRAQNCKPSTSRDIRVQNRRLLTSEDIRCQNRKSLTARDIRVQNRGFSSSKDSRVQNRRPSTCVKTFAPNRYRIKSHRPRRQNVHGYYSTTDEEDLSSRKTNKKMRKTSTDFSTATGRHLMSSAESPLSNIKPQIPRSIPDFSVAEKLNLLSSEESLRSKLLSQISPIVSDFSDTEKVNLLPSEGNLTPNSQAQVLSWLLPLHLLPLEPTRFSPIGDSSPSTYVQSPESTDSPAYKIHRYFEPPDTSFKSFESESERHPSEGEKELSEFSEDSLLTSPQSHTSCSITLPKRTRWITTETSASTSMKLAQLRDLLSGSTYLGKSVENLSASVESEGTPVGEGIYMESNVDNFSENLRSHQPSSTGAEVICLIPNEKSCFLNATHHLASNEKNLSTNFQYRTAPLKDFYSGEDIHLAPSEENLSFKRLGYQTSTPEKDHYVAEEQSLTSNPKQFSFKQHGSQYSPTKKDYQSASSNEEKIISSKRHSSKKCPPMKDHPFTIEKHLVSNEERLTFSPHDSRKSPPLEEHTPAKRKRRTSNAEGFSFNRHNSKKCSPEKYHSLAKGKHLASHEERLSLSPAEGKHLTSDEIKLSLSLAEGKHLTSDEVRLSRSQDGRKPLTSDEKKLLLSRAKGTHSASDEEIISRNFQSRKLLPQGLAKRRYQALSEKAMLSNSDVASKSLPRLNIIACTESQPFMLDGESSVSATCSAPPYINMGTFPSSPDDRRSVILHQLWSSVVKNDQTFLPVTDPSNPNESPIPAQEVAREPTIVSYKQLSPKKFLVGVNMSLSPSELYKFMRKRGNYNPCISDV